MSVLPEVPPQEAVVTTFAELPLVPKLLRVIAGVGYVTPSPIQARFIPAAVTGKDFMGKAQTGTGKTAAFLLPILQQFKPDYPSPSVLILAPTRELVSQIAE